MPKGMLGEGSWSGVAQDGEGGRWETATQIKAGMHFETIEYDKQCRENLCNY
jgi:hypothetical protein